MIKYVNIGLIVVIFILLISFFIVLGTGAQKESLYAPSVPINMGNGVVRFVTSG